ncbi:hypothetical protein SAMN05421759_10412 [Roseivivax lentus]|uniref:DUF6473 domain-containing protein n=1 Tax=Roseivivax lentus TaxID=633194 RepID=A0A1N7M635_9RHOB|nr:DUF6473 family protein [Roseivivax lentus]SIS81540.1 hypothetical protein SAMN05421759_10412 [Roseivivax lentus]
MYSNDIRGGLDYGLCRYGKSRVRFRGPMPDLTADLLVCLGGTETFGRFHPDPWPQLLGDRLGAEIANFGQVNAGLDLFLQDPEVLRIASGARLCVMQVIGAQNMSNRFYSVHPRRNDRFVKASDALMTLYPDVDFSQIAFTGALMTTLFDTSPERFEVVVREVQVAWVSRMRLILGHLPRPVHLLWFAESAPPANARAALIPPLKDPSFITREMLDALSSRIGGVVEIVEPASARSTEGMVFSEFDAMLAATMLSATAHDRAAQALSDCLRHLWDARGDRDDASD